MFHQIVADADGVRQRHARNEGEGLEDALAHFIVLTTAVLHRDGRAAAHAQSQQNRGEEGHEGVGREPDITKADK